MQTLSLPWLASAQNVFYRLHSVFLHLKCIFSTEHIGGTFLLSSSVTVIAFQSAFGPSVFNVTGGTAGLGLLS